MLYRIYAIQVQGFEWVHTVDTLSNVIAWIASFNERTLPVQNVIFYLFWKCSKLMFCKITEHWDVEVIIYLK